MDFSDTLILVNMAGLVVLALIGWTQIKAAKQQVLEVVHRDLAEINHKVRQVLKRAGKQDDQIGNNHEKIMMLEVNLANMQDEMEKTSRRLDTLPHHLAFGTPVEFDPDNESTSELVPDSEKKHLFD